MRLSARGDQPHASLAKATARRVCAVALAMGLLCLAAAAAQPAAAQTGQGELSGQVPAGGGFGLVVWGGGNTAAIQSAANARGCVAVSVFVTRQGAFLGFIFGAPSFVNEPFLAAFPGGTLSGGSPLILVCRDVGQAVVEQLNRVRTERGLPALRADPRLAAAGGRYAQALFDFGWPDRPLADVHTLSGSPKERANGEGYPGDVAETVHFRRRQAVDVQRDAASVVQAWLDSPENSAIVVGREMGFKDAGVGCFRGPAPELLLICVGNFGFGE